MKNSLIARRRRARGFSMIEVLVSLLVVSFGMLAMVGLQASAVRFSTDARDRGSATFLADQLFGRLLIADRGAIAAFNHNSGGAACSTGTTPSTNAVIDGWLKEVARQLPNATAATQKVTVTNAVTGDIEVVLCWKHASDASGLSRSMTVRNRVQWQ
jgi:type IV pilus assembly protein PilV